MNPPTQIKFARIGEIISGTTRTADLLDAFTLTLQGLVFFNGSWFAMPEHLAHRDRLAKLIGDAHDCFADDGEGIAPGKEDEADEIVDDLFGTLEFFAPPYVTFGANPGDGASFGFWPDIDQAKEYVGFVSSKENEFPETDFRGEWLHVNDHGNCTLYVREDDGTDTEIWSVV